MTQIPSKAQILEWVAEHPEANSKRDIAKAFGIKGAERIELKRLLKELEAEGQLERRRRHYLDAEKLPPVTVLELLAPDGSGDLFARPLEASGEGPVPRILFVPRKSDPALGRGDRFLGRLIPILGEDHQYEARLIRRITASPEYKPLLDRQGLTPSELSPAALTERVKRDYDYWQGAVKPLGIKAE